MTKKNKKNGKSKRISNKRGEGPLDATLKTLQRVPTCVKTVYPMRRSWTQQIPYNPGAGGWASSSYNFQINFAASVSNINLGGVGTYAPTTPNSSEFAAIFDQYRIKRVTVRMDWDLDSFSYTNLAQVAPLLFVVADYDSSVDAAVNDLMQYPGLINHSFMQNGYSPLIVELSPRPLMDVASTGVLTAYAPSKVTPFIDTSYMTVPHYGIKVSCVNMGASQNAVVGYLQITAYIDLEFINPK
jgi:hypothetical protein